MKRGMQMMAALVLSVSVGACAGDRSPDADENAARPGAGEPGTAGTAGMLDGDRNFVEEQTEMGMAEIELGKLAQQKGMHADVKEFGAMMVRDHQMAADELKPIATRLRGTAAAETRHTGDHKDALEEFANLTGRDFDKRYIDRMIDDHQEGIDDLEGKAENANDPELKAWAAKTLPKMREHLERAKSIKETLDRAGDSY